MVIIWGGAPSTEPFSFGAHSSGQTEESQEQGIGISISNSGLENEENEYDSDDSLAISLGNNVARTNSAGNEATTRKHVVSNPVPMLKDNKRKHMDGNYQQHKEISYSCKRVKNRKNFAKIYQVF